MSEGKKGKDRNDLMQAIQDEPRAIGKNEELMKLYEKYLLGHASAVFDFIEKDEITSNETDIGIATTACDSIPELTKTLNQIAKLLPPISSAHILSVARALEFFTDNDIKTLYGDKARSQNAKHASSSSNNSPAKRKQFYKQEVLRLYNGGEYKNPTTATARVIAPLLGDFATKKGLTPLSIDSRETRVMEYFGELIKEGLLKK